MVEFDPGPPKAVATHLMAVPTYAPHRELFWYDWGPVFYRGRLDRSAKLLCIASDPGPTERIAGRTLVGDAGQRVQGFLTKLGLTRSYVLVNAFAYALLPSKASKGTPILSEPAHLAWRNTLLDKIIGPQLQAVVAFGGAGAGRGRAVGRPAGRAAVRGAAPVEPQRRSRWSTGWRAAITALRGIVTPDDDGDATGPNYGSSVRGGRLRADSRARPAVRGAAVARRRPRRPHHQAQAPQLLRAPVGRPDAHARLAGARPDQP